MGSFTLHDLLNVWRAARRRRRGGAAALGRFGSARAAYRDASELDEVPLGAPSSFNQALQAIAAETGTQYVDVPRDLMRHSKHGLVCT